MDLFDSHIHLCHCEMDLPEEWTCLANFCRRTEWENFPLHGDPRILKSFGVHPQQFSLGISGAELDSEIAFLEELLTEGKIFAVGEIGFDRFEERFRETMEIQEEFWRIQTALAARFSRPIVVHARKSMELLFGNSGILKSLPAVVFHSFPGGVQDARSLLKRGVNAYFSLGKHQVLNGKRLTLELLGNWREFDSRILLETDAPYQTLMGEGRTSPSEIGRVYAAASEVAGEDFLESVSRAVSGLTGEFRRID